MTRRTPACDLKSCFLCQRCLPEWIPAVAAHRQTLHFRNGEVIFGEGTTVRGIYFVYSGTVKVHKQWGTEKELIIRFAREGTVFGHRGLGRNNQYPISATAIGPVTACFIDLDFFQATLKVNQGFL
ncbi:MAG TPA: cyclic nucleotide-binding domain-containing protein, partial [Puia sp.]|nr:cyclic nucleotide-binding domain-containing protein [Puia sp.]